MIFVWVEKQMISDMIYFFEEKDMKYVENVVWVQLDKSSISIKII
jgi:hypothetical protein